MTDAEFLRSIGGRMERFELHRIAGRLERLERIEVAAKSEGVMDAVDGILCKCVEHRAKYPDKDERFRATNEAQIAEIVDLLSILAPSAVGLIDDAALAEPEITGKGDL